jgi:hypothetical protein
MLVDRRLRGHRRSCANAGGRCARAQARRRVPLERSRRPGAVRLRDRRGARILRSASPVVRHLPRPPDPRVWPSAARPSR